CDRVPDVLAGSIARLTHAARVAARAAVARALRGLAPVGRIAVAVQVGAGARAEVTQVVRAGRGRIARSDAVAGGRTGFSNCADWARAAAAIDVGLGAVPDTVAASRHRAGIRGTDAGRAVAAHSADAAHTAGRARAA